MTLFNNLSWFFREHWRTYLVALLMLAGVAMLNLAVPYLIGLAIDELITATETTTAETDIRPYLLALFVLGIGVYALRYGWRLILFGTSYRLGSILRARFYQRLCKQGQAFYSINSTGDLMARATNDVDAIELAAGEGVLSGFDGLLTFILVLIIMFAVIDWRLTLVALMPFPVMAWAFHRISRSVHQHFQQALDCFSRLNQKTQEALSGIRLVKAMGREEIESQAFSSISEQAADSNYRVAQAEACYDPVIHVCLSTALLFTMSYGTWLIWQQQLSIGQLASFTMYLGQLIWPMFAFGWLLNIVERGSAAFKRVDQLLKTADTINDKAVLTPTGAELRVRNLTFSYPNSHTATLNQLSFDLPAGKVLAIVGPTGSGKTTLIQLLMRQWQSEPDMILMDGLALSQYSLKALRDQYAYVPQDSFLFSISIAENIALTSPSASQDEIEAVAKIACIHQDILSFPEAYQTQVGERGVTLSGGQRQRICIARALLSKAPVLILDDALSAVDVHTEQQIITHLKDSRNEQSSIIISHRLSAVEHADETLVLTHGCLQQQGNHDQLITQDGWYSRMWTYQRMEARLEET
ncbi:ABC transporter ATP-binding protein [Motiliproteus sp. MSK22-1]|uniref:ABC transporter ATP-binding protein n=1 Tax=Motiliproteus sp. MSK22-1 TaxID=1897630 RepID=UPI0009769676|nr:ABC transporter transmembrane domain-containing protein [Motiliproteus sp. MSK22-1]OMH25873.1 ABC transporter ATP-binding protein [Motiliproteus sp. MSK22-1]